MSNMLNLTIDGKEVSALENTNIIDAAELAGIHIPNLCYIKGMKGVGACRLCLVDIEGMKAPVIACNTKVKEGMKINTRSEEIQEARKFIIDLILSMHPLDCMTCTKAGVCNLQRYAYDFELKESTFTRKKFGYPIDSANPFIKRDPDYCILCGRCVRVCKEQGTNVLDFMGRGVGARVITVMDRPLQESECTFCGSCIDVCPVNAILEADRWRKGREWEYTKIKSVCLSCGNGCDITVSIKDGTVAKINRGAEEGSVENYICAIGRFGFDSLTSDRRLTTPLKRVDNELKETTWKDALNIVGKKLKNAGENTGIVSVAGILNEDAFVLSRFAEDVVRTKNVDTTVSLYADVDSIKYSDTVDIDTADLFILIGLNPSQWERILPALDAGIRKRIERGARVVVINSTETKISAIASVNIKDDEIYALKQIAKALIEKGYKAEKGMDLSLSDINVTEDAEKVATLLLESKEPLILTSGAFFDTSRNISMLIKTNVISVPLEANARGVVTAGLITQGKDYKEMVNGEVEVLYVVGEIPLNRRPEGVDFLIVQNSHMTELAKQADMVLPSAVFLETYGTIVDYLGRIKCLSKAVEPAGDSKPHREIFIEISDVLGKTIKEPKEADIRKALKTKAKITFRPLKKKEGLDIDPQEMIESINASVINGSRLSWLKEVKEVGVTT